MLGGHRRLAGPDLVQPLAVQVAELALAGQVLHPGVHQRADLVQRAERHGVGGAAQPGVQGGVAERRALHIGRDLSLGGLELRDLLLVGRHVHAALCLDEGVDAARVGFLLHQLAHGGVQVGEGHAGHHWYPA
jgi:hypothetical protein